MSAALTALRRLRHGPLKGLDPVWTSLGRLYRFFFRALGLGRPVSTRIGPYGPFRLNGLFAFSDFEHWGGGHNDAFVACVEACRGKRCVLDIGAHVGLVALPMASVVAPGGRVVCFEPAEANRRLLLEHAALNGFAAIEVVPCLVGADSRSDVPFFEMAEPTGMNALVVRKNAGAYKAILRPQVSLDDFCAGRGVAPEVVKIDVEGAEIGVLRGARKTLARHRPLIFLSVHPRDIELMGENIEALSELIGSLGYDCKDAQGRAPSRFELREYVMTPRTA